MAHAVTSNNPHDLTQLNSFAQGQVSLKPESPIIPDQVSTNATASSRLPQSLVAPVSKALDMPFALKQFHQVDSASQIAILMGLQMVNNASNRLQPQLKGQQNFLSSV